jgi:hypothetical protein
MVEGNLYVVDGRVETAEDVPAEISVWGTSSAPSTPTRPATPPTWAMARR